MGFALEFDESHKETETANQKNPSNIFYRFAIKMDSAHVCLIAFYADQQTGRYWIATYTWHFGLLAHSRRQLLCACVFSSSSSFVREIVSNLENITKRNKSFQWFDWDRRLAMSARALVSFHKRIMSVRVCASGRMCLNRLCYLLSLMILKEWSNQIHTKTALDAIV